LEREVKNRAVWEELIEEEKVGIGLKCHVRRRRRGSGRRRKKKADRRLTTEVRRQKKEEK